ncbi:MAG: type II secretion system protein [Fimbriimonadaceae bacterium]|nr:type II secretion system protein [Fimbriimonadaceae bacterium]
MYPGQAQNKPNNNVLWIVLAVLAVAGCACLAILAAVLFPVFSQARFAAQRSMAISNLKQSSLAVLMYSADWNDRLPPGVSWVDATFPYAKNDLIYRSPAASKVDKAAYGFAFRKELGLKKIAGYRDPDRWAMIFDSTILIRNATSGLETMPQPGRYGSGASASNGVAFLDGHARSLLDEDRSNNGPDGNPLVR